MNYVEILKKLTAVAQPSGLEHPQAQVLEELAKPYVDEIYTDAVGMVFYILEIFNHRVCTLGIYVVLQTYAMNEQIKIDSVCTYSFCHIYGALIAKLLLHINKGHANLFHNYS